MARRGGRTVGRLIADALATAGVRWAFTVPGERFLELLRNALAAGLPALLHLEVDPRRVTPDRFG